MQLRVYHGSQSRQLLITRRLCCRRVLCPSGHGGDVKYCQWHPTKGLIASCSKDALTKLWDPRNGQCMHTLHGHKSTITQLQWNLNGNWLLTACRDQSLKVGGVGMGGWAAAEQRAACTGCLHHPPTTAAADPWRPPTLPRAPLPPCPRHCVLPDL